MDSLCVLYKYKWVDQQVFLLIKNNHVRNILFSFFHIIGHGLQFLSSATKYQEHEHTCVQCPWMRICCWHCRWKFQLELWRLKYTLKGSLLDLLSYDAPLLLAKLTWKCQSVSDDWMGSVSSMLDHLKVIAMTSPSRFLLHINGEKLDPFDPQNICCDLLAVLHHL